MVVVVPRGAGPDTRFVDPGAVEGDVPTPETPGREKLGVLGRPVGSVAVVVGLIGLNDSWASLLRVG